MKSNTHSLIIFFVILSTTACLFLNVEKRGYQIIDSIPVYDESVFIQESRTTYPDSQPSIIRTYQTDASREELLSYYETYLVDQEWNVQVADNPDPLVPWGILAQKDDWQIRLLFYSDGQLVIQVFLK